MEIPKKLKKTRDLLLERWKDLIIYNNYTRIGSNTNEFQIKYASTAHHLFTEIGIALVKSSLLTSQWNIWH